MLELLLVLVIIGVIAALAVPRFSNIEDRTRYTATWSQYGRFEAALNLYRSVWHDYPTDVLHGSPPGGMSTFIRSRSWQREPPIGGVWDWNNRRNGAGVTNPDWNVLGPNIAITQSPFPAALGVRMNLLDAIADDNSQTTGKLRRVNTRFLCMFLEE